MKDFLKQTLNLLKRRVQYNLSIIRSNEKVVREILQEPVSSNRSEKLNEKYNINKTMLEENNDSIKLQLSIIQFLDKYSKQLQEFIDNTEHIIPELRLNQNNSETTQKVVELGKEDYLDLTINDGIEYNEEHPYYNDDEFFDMLLKYYTDEENYEMCLKLISIKEQKQQHSE